MPGHQGRARLRTAKSSLRCCRVFVKFSGARTKCSPDPGSGIFAHFIICFLHKLLLNGKQMDGQQVCAQMALLGDEDKERRDSEFGKVALSPSPTVAGLPPRPPPAARSLSSAPPTFVRRKAATG
ncbi:hypothetical protein CapIbe_001108 [Capra ibex]